MYRILRQYYCGDKIKYISFPLSNKYFNKKINEQVLRYAEDINKIECNLIRAKSMVRDYVLCNDFKLFCTITINQAFYNRQDLDNLRRLINDRIRYYRKKYKLPLKYILVPEQHKKGGWHFHGVLDASFKKFVYVNQNGYDSLSIFDFLGFSSCELIRDKARISSYILKYMTKDFALRHRGKHLYFCSRGLIKPILKSEIAYNNNNLDSQFWEVKNDFCYMSYFDKSFNLKSFLK